MSDRSGRRVSIIRELAAAYLRSEANTSPLITVLGAEVSADARHAMIYVSVFPESETDAALAYLRRKRSDLRDYAKKHGGLKTLPFFDFAAQGTGV